MVGNGSSVSNLQHLLAQITDSTLPRIGYHHTPQQRAATIRGDRSHD